MSSGTDAIATQLVRLKRQVDAAAAERQRPPEDDEVTYVLALESYLDDAGWRDLWATVRALRELHGATFNKYPEDSLPGAIVNLLSKVDGTPSLAEISAALADEARNEGPWLIETPLSGLEMQRPVMRLGPETVLWRADFGDHDRERWSEHERESDDNSVFELHRLLGDRLPRVQRWLTFGSGERFDSRRAAAIISVERGNVGLALARSRAKAQYAIAVWVLMSPPQPDRLIPDLASWVPQPFVRWQQGFKQREDEQWPPRQPIRGRAIRVWHGYETPDEKTLSLPYRAFAVRERHCAHALLSASFMLLSAGRRSRSQLSEQLRDARAAIEVLCESAPGARDAAERWERLASRLQLDAQLGRRGYEAGDASKIALRLRDARNVAAHGADSALIDLGWPADRDRRLIGNLIARPEDLGFSALQADLSAFLAASGLALERLWTIADATDFDETSFEAEFA